MDLLFVALLFPHLLGLMLVAAAFLPLLGMMGDAAVLPTTSRLLTGFGHHGIVLLLLTGPLLLLVRYGGIDGVSHWFWAKMLFVIVLAGGVVTSALSARKMRAGDAAATRRACTGRTIAVLALVAVVLCAVLAFG
jgi:protoporphyrinogen IX oxidase